MHVIGCFVCSHNSSDEIRRTPYAHDNSTNHTIERKENAITYAPTHEVMQ